MIELGAGDLACLLDPETGGAIAALTWRGAPLLRAVADARLAAQHGRAVAAYPLIPYANRIAWGRFAWSGVTHQLARNFGDHPHTIHGNAWMRPWATGEQSADCATITLDHTPPRDWAEEWPFAYRAEQAFHLTPAELRITMSVQNRDRLAWPAGVGLHPYVARPPSARLRFRADSVWTTDPDSLPNRRVPLTAGEDDFSAGRALDGSEIDACFNGWNGMAEISATGHPSLAIHADAVLGHVQVYTPAGHDYFGLEPVSNMPDAMNRMATVPDAGLRILQPGETLTTVIRITVSPPC